MTKINTLKFVLAITVVVLLVVVADKNIGSVERISYFGQSASIARMVTLPFKYSFSQNGVLHEAGSPDESSSPYWWLNSGGTMPISGGMGMTGQGDISVASKWYRLYLKNNSLDTDGGLHPQNVFRLITRLTWEGNIRQEVYAKIIADRLSLSPNRNSSNGILLFNRYKDANNLYYAGIRVDGSAVIKKKLGGVYHTMAQKQAFSEGKYERILNPNLLPKDTWIGIRSDTSTNPDKSVTVKLFVDEGKTGNWIEVLSATDDGLAFGGPVIEAPGHGGIRTDFMDILFDDYRLIRI